ncbi:hypothetical protein VTO42DRAFT_7907 [Malbranchea cinnamomea]
MTDNSHNQIQLFAQCSLCIVCTQDLDKDTAAKLASIAREYGGEAVIHESPAPLPSLTEFTHVVSSTIDFPGHDAICDALIPVVKPQWIYASISKRKLANPRQYNPDPRLFLNDVVVSTVDLPEGDKDAIIGGVLAMGGLYTSKITNSTTHLVALNLDSDKCKAARSRGLKIKIVLPHWFDDCLKLGKRIDERPYMLPDPEILRVRPDAPVRTTENKDIIGASSPEPKELTMPLESEDARPDLDVFKGKKIMISSDLAIGERLLQSIEQLIEKGGGKVTHDVEETDIYVCRYREGDDYRRASRLGKDVGNLSWLYHLITHNTWTSPLRRLLHYPIARDGIPGFKNFKISLSNYAGEARIYLENLIIASGAECTKTLKQDNTHLITAHGSSEKCTAAREWNLHIVNHLWLEDSYAKWQLQTVSQPRYTHFPKRTNLGEIVGQTRIDRFAVEAHFFPPENHNALGASTTPTPPTMQQKDKNLPIGQNNAADKSKTVKQAATSEAVTPKGGKDAKTASNSSSKKNKDKAYQTPVVSRFIAEGKENETPSTTGSRKSKDIAVARLHDYIPDIALYEKERRRVGGVIYGGRRKSSEQVIAKKRSAEPEEAPDAEDGVETKKTKKSRPPVAMHVLLTGYAKWVGQPKLEDSDKRRLRELGILLVQDASRCTHLAAPSILRTQKFVNALAYAPKIINCDFITDCINEEKLLNPDDYILRDKESEKRYNFTLEEALRRARQNKNKLLQGRTIYCVENIHGGFDAFRSIIETNGGQCALFRGRAGIAIGGRRAVDEGDASNASTEKDVYLISGTEKSHQKLWPKFRALAHDAKKNPRIVRTDWLLDSVLCQELRWKDEWELGGCDMAMADD